MYDLATIEAMAREQAKQASQRDLKPFIVWKEDLEAMPPFPFPNIGDYRPRGYRLVKTHFVDSSGFGEPGEAALTAQQFKAKIKVDRGYAIIQEGQFQVDVGEFIEVRQRSR